jgi:hypothetical protein
MKITVFCGVKPSNVVEAYRRFGRTYCVCLQVNPEDGDSIVMIGVTIDGGFRLDIG